MNASQAMIDHILSQRQEVVSVGPRPWIQRALKRCLGWSATAVLSLGLSASAQMVAPDQVEAVQASTSTDSSTNEQSHRQAHPSSLVSLARTWWNAVEADQRERGTHLESVAWSEEMPSQEVAGHLIQLKEPFMALAVTLEGLETKPYRDGCGWNVGMGYCLDARLREFGEDRVRQDLTHAGVAESVQQVLVDRNASEIRQVELEPLQALKLLKVTENDYRAIARTTLGEETFDNLPQHRQASMTWLAYNTGEGFEGFRRLHRAVQNEDAVAAMENMTPFFHHDGAMRANARAGAWLQAAYFSEASFQAGLAQPEVVESLAQEGVSPIRGLVVRADLPRTLPRSPYVIHARHLPGAEETVEAAVEPAPESSTGLRRRFEDRLRQNNAAETPTPRAAMKR